MNAVFQHFKELMGTKESLHELDISRLYGQPLDLAHLQEPFSSLEVQQAVHDLAPNKASGPDGLPNEFAKQHWPSLQPHIMHVFHNLYSLQTDLTQINEATIILLPKKDIPNTVADFRPISIINLIPKIFSKVLANRLKPHISDLIDAHQTAFVQGRFIAENFLATREVLYHIHQSKNPTLLLKLDFMKTFDTLDWGFLLKAMSVRGFPPKFCNWISHLLSTASSRVLVNDQLTPPFKHCRGLRQGDPISPYLFLIAADVFQQMTRAASTTIPHHLTSKLRQPIITFQYADDTILFTSAKGDTLRRLLLTIHCFSSSSRLRVNFSKSTFVPLSIPRQQLLQIESLLKCNHQLLPITYLGMPLTLRAPKRQDFTPLLLKLEHRLEGWKSRFISRGGKLQLVKSVLSTIPTYFMSCFSFPKWLLARIDRIRRSFLWGKNDSTEAIHLVNWQVVCLPIRNGGMGVVNLQLQNISLHLRWWWTLYAADHRLWTIYATLLYAASWHCHKPRILSNAGSFFWRSILKLKPLFYNCTHFQLLSGKQTSFWFDSWAGQPLAGGKTRPLEKKTISVREAANCFFQLIPGPHTLHQHEAHARIMLLTNHQGHDQLTWNLSPSGLFSVRSSYALLSQCGRTTSLVTTFWKAKVTPSMKIFFFLLLNNRLLTHDIMLRRNMNFSPGCVLCGCGHPETAMHLFFECPYVLPIWTQLSTLLGCTMLQLDKMPSLSFSASTRRNRNRLQTWRTHFITATWFIWRERNERIFCNTSTTHALLAQKIQLEAAMCLQFC